MNHGCFRGGANEHLLQCNRCFFSASHHAVCSRSWTSISIQASAFGSDARVQSMSLMHLMSRHNRRAHSSWRITTDGFPSGGNPVGGVFVVVSACSSHLGWCLLCGYTHRKSSGCSTSVMRCFSHKRQCCQYGGKIF